MGLFLFVTSWRQIFIVMEEEKPKKKRKKKAAEWEGSKEHKKNWREVNATPEEIEAKIPEDADCVFVRVDQNKLWWLRGEESGSVFIWD